MTLQVFKLWIDILLYRAKPAELARTTGLKKGLKHLALASLIAGILAGTYQMLARPYLSEILGMGTIPESMLELFYPSGPTAIILSAISAPIMNIIGILIMGTIIWVVAIILGGKGGLKNYIGTLAIIDAAIIGIVSAGINILSILASLAGPGALEIMALTIQPALGLLSLLYLLFLYIRATQAVHKVSGLKALLIIMLPFIVMVFILGFLAAMLATALLAGNPF